MHFNLFENYFYSNDYLLRNSRLISPSRILTSTKRWTLILNKIVVQINLQLNKFAAKLVELLPFNRRNQSTHKRVTYIINSARRRFPLKCGGSRWHGSPHNHNSGIPRARILRLFFSLEVLRHICLKVLLDLGHFRIRKCFLESASALSSFGFLAQSKPLRQIRLVTILG